MATFLGKIIALLIFKHDGVMFPGIHCLENKKRGTAVHVHCGEVGICAGLASLRS
jgi:hypothetical protein